MVRSGNEGVEAWFEWGWVGELEAAGHVDLDFAVWGHVRGEQRVHAAFVLVGQDAGPFGFGQDVLEHQGVDVDEGGLEEVQGEYRELLLVAAVAGKLAALAEEDDVVDVVPAFDDLQAGVDLAL
jgi:hypothetical protein